MPNILTAAEAANFLRTETTDTAMLNLLPLVDSFIQRATGRDWTADTTINPIAKAAAGMLLVQWYDVPGQSGSQVTDSPLAFGLTNVLGQLEAQSLKYRSTEFYGASSAGSVLIPGARVGDVVQKLVGVYGVSGDQSAKFEGVISVAGTIQQNVGDLSANRYVVVLKAPGDDVSA